MSNWFVDYHHALQLRLLCFAVVFGIIWPGLALLVAGIRSVDLHVRDRWRRSHAWQGERLWRRSAP